MAESMIVNRTIESLLEESVQRIFTELVHNKDYPQPGLFVGRAGMLLFALEYYRHTQDPKAHGLIGHHANNLIENIDTAPGILFCNGITGIAWTLNYMFGMGLLDDDVLGFLNQVDEYVKEAEKTMTVDSDFMYGTTGLANYFLDRGQINYAFDLMRKVVESGVHSEHGLYWESSDVNSDGAPITILNLSSAHGSAAVLVVLAKIYSKTPDQKQKSFLANAMKETIRFIEYARSLDQSGFYPGTCQHVEQGIVSNVGRLSWCYGDMGIGLALNIVGEALNDKIITQQSILCYEKILARREDEKKSFQDACFCHGPSGVAQMYMRMFYNTQNEAYKKTARFWMDETLKCAKHDCVTGYKEWDNVAEAYIPSYSILGGISGIGLCMLGYLNESCLNWDRAFLLSK